MNWRDVFFIALALCIGLVVYEIVRWWKGGPP
jgi:hypothetical protein